MEIQIINGPNLNLLGKREVEIYGNTSFEDYYTLLKKNNNFTINYFQSNSEGEIIDKIHEVGFSCDGIIINAGAYSHTSLAIADAISGIKSPTIEVHISNIYKRETFRHKSYLSAVCKGLICGFGLDSYQLAIHAIKNIIENTRK